MYAVVRTGGKQYRVTAGDIFEVEKLEGEVGEVISLDDVLLVSDGDSATIGQPLVDGASVQAKITGQYRGKKILVFRYRPKKRIRVRRGHRQYLTRLEIASVNFGGVTYDTVPEKASTDAEKPKRAKKKKAPTAAPVAAAAPIIAEAIPEPVVEETIVEEVAVEEVAVEEVAVEEVAVEEVAVEEAVIEEVVAEVETVEEVAVEEVASDAVAPPAVGDPDDLTKVTGIGKVFQGRLQDEFGITTFAQLAQANAEKLAELCERSLDEVNDWIAQAKELAG